MIKRGFDFIFALIGLILLSPILCFVSLMIKVEDEGPILFQGDRIGLCGKSFKMFKFRSMVVAAEKIGGSSTADDDPRITRIGKFLRKYKLDELPQLINVLRGDMSIVGPRPEVKHYTDLFTEEERVVLTVRPGITDWASIWNANEGAILAGENNPEQAYMELIRPKKLKLQMKYVRERSFWLDIKIIYLTIIAVIRPDSQAVREIRGGS